MYCVFLSLKTLPVNYAWQHELGVQWSFSLFVSTYRFFPHLG